MKTYWKVVASFFIIIFGIYGVNSGLQMTNLASDVAFAVGWGIISVAVFASAFFLTLLWRYT